MNNSTEVAALFDTLKQILKSKKVTYCDLAIQLGSSESSIKRLFSLQECSLSRLSEILGVLNISFTDLVEISAQDFIETTEFSKAAEDFMSTSLDYFYIYRKLFHHGDVETVRKREGLTKAAMSKYLKKLDDLGAIKWLAGDKVKFPTSDFLKFRKDGPLRMAVYREWAPKFHHFVLDNLGNDKHSLRIFSARCSSGLKQKFMGDFEDLVKYFLKQAALELKINPSQVEPVGFSLATGPLRVGLDPYDL